MLNSTDISYWCQLSGIDIIIFGKQMIDLPAVYIKTGPLSTVPLIIVSLNQFN